MDVSKFVDLMVRMCCKDNKTAPFKMEAPIVLVL